MILPDISITLSIISGGSRLFFASLLIKISIFLFFPPIDCMVEKIYIQQPQERFLLFISGKAGPKKFH